MKSVKTPKSIKQFHTSNSKTGMGDYTGTGVKNPVGKSRDVMGSGKVSRKKTMGTPPKSLA